MKRENFQSRLGFLLVSAGCAIGIGNVWKFPWMVATRQSEDWLREHSPIPLFQQKIRRTDKVTESTYAAQPVTRWSPTSAAARDYRAWVEELMEVQ